MIESVDHLILGKETNKMYQINFNSPIHVHFIGIGGISMSGLAQILIKAGFTVSGSDQKKSPLTQHLVSMGAKVNYPQMASNINDNIVLVVHRCDCTGQSRVLCCLRKKHSTYDTRRFTWPDYEKL